MKNKFLLVCYIFLVINIYSQDITNDQNKKVNIFDKDYVPNEKLKESKVIFNIGGSIILKSRIAFGENGQYFEFTQNNLIKPLPNNKWIGIFDTKIYSRVVFQKDCFLHLGIKGVFKFSDGFIVPLFNFDEFYLTWKYPIGRLSLGRTNYSLKASTIFSGSLDGIELYITVPYLNFKTFLGYAGFLGLFHPYFNPYTISEYDISYIEETNLLIPAMIFKIDAEQPRRIFLATDFDINFYGQHINPYFLMQMDISNIPVKYYSNTKNLINTFHLGLNIEGRIIENLYYQLHFSGLLGFNQDLQTNNLYSIISCAFISKLRYTISKAANSTFLIGYALGNGNSEKDFNFWKDNNNKTINKFYYYGRFDGGYVLNPILSNIHLISFKYMVTPINKFSNKLTLYIGAYQTFKLFSQASISDSSFNSDNYLVGTEFDFGLIVTARIFFTFSIDSGVLLPENDLSNFYPKFKIGANISFVF